MKEDESKPWQSTLQDFGRALHETTFVVIDLETTGGAPHLGAAITEIGAIQDLRRSWTSRACLHH